MAMIRAALRGGRVYTSPSSIPSLRHSSSAMVISLPSDTTEFCADKPEPKAESCAETQKELVVGRTMRSFLKEQRGFLNEVLYHLKDQRVLLNSIREELGLQKTDSGILKGLIDDTVSLSEDVDLYFSECKPKEELAMNAVSTPCINAEVIEAEQSEKNIEQGSSVIFERTSGNGVPIDSSEQRSKISDLPAKKEADTDIFQHPSWPEWAAFLNHLRPYASAEECPKVGRELFGDTTILKRAIVKFAQAHEGIFRSLCRNDLLILVQHEFPSMDAKTATGKKKLQSYLEVDESRGNRKENNKVSQAKLTDVVRLVYRAVRSMPILGGALPSELRLAIVHILQDLNSASIAHNNSAASKVESTAVTSQTTQEMNQEIDLAKIDEGETSGDSNRTVDGEASPHERNANIDHSVDPKDGISKTRTVFSSSLDLPKFGSLKERVDAKRKRLARESLGKEVANSLLPPPLLTKELNLRAMNKSIIAAEKSKDDCVVARNFEAFDAIIESDDFDGCLRSKTPGKNVSGRKPVSGAFEFRYANKKMVLSTQNKAMVTHSGQKHLKKSFNSTLKPIHDKGCAGNSASSDEDDLVDYDDEFQIDSEDESGSEDECHS